MSVGSFPKSEQRFATALSTTQMFSSLVQETVEPSTTDVRLLFFSEFAACLSDRLAQLPHATTSSAPSPRSNSLSSSPTSTPPILSLIASSAAVDDAASLPPLILEMGLIETADPFTVPPTAAAAAMATATSKVQLPEWMVSGPKGAAAAASSTFDATGAAAAAAASNGTTPLPLTPSSGGEGSAAAAAAAASASSSSISSPFASRLGARLIAGASPLAPASAASSSFASSSSSAATTAITSSTSATPSAERRVYYEYDEWPARLDASSIGMEDTSSSSSDSSAASNNNNARTQQQPPRTPPTAAEEASQPFPSMPSPSYSSLLPPSLRALRNESVRDRGYKARQLMTRSRGEYRRSFSNLSGAPLPLLSSSSSSSSAASSTSSSSSSSSKSSAAKSKQRPMYSLSQIVALYISALPSRISNFGSGGGGGGGSSSIRSDPITEVLRALGLVFHLEHIGFGGDLDESIWRALLIACGRVGGIGMRSLAIKGENIVTSSSTFFLVLYIHYDCDSLSHTTQIYRSILFLD